MNNIKYFAQKIIKEISHNQLHEADHDTTHILARVKYPKPTYMNAMRLKGCLKKAVDYGPKLRSTTIKFVKIALNKLIQSIRISEHEEVSHETK